MHRSMRHWKLALAMGSIGLALGPLSPADGRLTWTRSTARADGPIILAPPGAVQGCPGQGVVFALEVRYDNCAGFRPGCPCARGNAIVTNVAGEPWPGATAQFNPVAGLAVVDGCTWNATFVFTVLIPPNAVPGQQAVHQIAIPITAGADNVAAIVQVTTTAIDCGPPPLPPGPRRTDRRQIRQVAAGADRLQTWRGADATATRWPAAPPSAPLLLRTPPVR